MDADYPIIATVRDLLDCSGKPVAIDIETDSLEWWSGNMIGLGFWTPSKSGYIPTLTNEERIDVMAAVEEIAMNPRTVIIAHNLAFEALWLELDVRKPICKYMDTMVMMHLDDSRQPKGLEDGAQHYFGMAAVKQVYKIKGKNQPIHEWPLEVVSAYCQNDCYVTYRLAERLMPALRAQGLEKLFWKDMKYLGLLIDVSRRGMLVDFDFMERAEKVISANVVLMERELMDKVGYEFNWKSTKQLSYALYDHMGIAKPINPFLDEDGVDRNYGKSALYTRYNSACTSSFLLMEKANHPLGTLVLDLRESDKLARIYLKQWRELADSDHVIHGSFNLTGTRTGRLSSSKPNLQNMPGEVRTRETQSVYSGGAIRSDEYNLRQAFVARPGYKFLSVDFKQQEARLFAILAQDEKMIQFVRERKDVHGEVAKMVWGSADDVHREWAKTLSFGMIYGMSTGSLQHRLNKTPQEAAAITTAYWQMFPRVLPFLNECVNRCSRDKYVRYWSGRIWREDDPKKAYKSANALVQGGGADLLSIAAMRCQDWLDANDAGHLVSLIHDELLLEVREEAFEEAAVALPKIQEVSDIFDVPFLTDAKAGYNYGSLEKLTVKVA